MEQWGGVRTLRSEQDTLRCNTIEISLCLFICIVHTVGPFSAQASNYDSIFSFMRHGEILLPNTSLTCACGKQRFVLATHKQKLFAIASCFFLYLLCLSMPEVPYSVRITNRTFYFLTLSPSIAPYGALTNKNLTARDPILKWVSNYAE